MPQVNATTFWTLGDWGGHDVGTCAMACLAVEQSGGLHLGLCVVWDVMGWPHLTSPHLTCVRLPSHRQGDQCRRSGEGLEESEGEGRRAGLYHQHRRFLLLVRPRERDGRADPG